MLHLFALDRYSFEELMFLIAAVCSGGYVIGYLTDLILTRRGFGPAGNGCLAIVGCMAGIYARNTYLGHAYGNDLMFTGIVGAASATAMLLTLGVVKHWLAD